MKSAVQMIKATVLGGILFLVPVGVVVFLLGKLVGILRVAAEPFDGMLPVDSVMGVLVADVLALLLIFFVCFVAGLLAMHRLSGRLVDRLDSGLLSTVPAYAFIKGMTESFAKSDEMAQSFLPILVRFDDYSQIAFEVERTERGNVIVYLPGAPNPWSGGVVYVEPSRVTPLDTTVADAVKNIRTLGRDTEKFDVAV